ncbi:enoyl-CoA hydratase-related protein [Streptomyces sp. NPDC001982]|uniref:enoyl-CoA hydratase-related protein n=1 Tax=Streptomyces sp. NPDC001982 TaxID=3154405 RepID=UPI00332CE67D
MITIDRPKARNAIDGTTARALAAAVDRLEARDDLRVGIISGAGGDFSAGMDLKAFAAGDTPIVEGRGFAGITRARIKTPLIAAVEGYALGGGTELALACDMIVAARNATFGLTEVRYGIVPPEGGMVRLPERAERFGLVNYLTEPGGALKRAAGIAHNAPLAVEAVKLVVNERRAFCDQDAFAEQDRIVAPVLASHDAQEGAHAFAEKRSPHWQGR